jgi:hypothetical protein
MCAQSANIVIEEGSQRNPGKFGGGRQDSLSSGGWAAAEGTTRMHIIVMTAVDCLWILF